MGNQNFLKTTKLADVARWCVSQFVVSVAGNLPPGTAILDAGAGECAYKDLFRHCTYKSIDLGIGDSSWDYRHLDYIAPLDNMPIDDECFDAVLCTQVLEHVNNPFDTVKEIYRVLKPGGQLFLTAPMSQGEHQIPYDYFRYTSYGLRHICELAGFQSVEVSPLGGMFLRWAYEVPRAMPDMPTSGIKSGKINLAGLLLAPVRIFILSIVRLVQMFLILVDPLDKDKVDPWGWKVVARK